MVCKLAGFRCQSGADKRSPIVRNDHGFLVGLQKLLPHAQYEIAHCLEHLVWTVARETV